MNGKSSRLGYRHTSRTRSRRYFVSEGIFGESENNAFPDILKCTVTHTLSYGIVTSFYREIN